MGMKRSVILTADEADGLALLGRRLRRARILRNISHREMAVRAGVTPKTYLALEAGKPTVSIGLLMKVMSVLGYETRLAALLESDPLGESMQDVRGRKRVGRRSDVADF